MPAELPYLAADLPAIEGACKVHWEDFRVEEVPGPAPDGHGIHTWIEIQKAGLTTARAAADVARALGVKPASVGRSGRKDARAVARQWLSVERVEPARALALDIPRISILRAVPHPRKLRRGWHSGNRFSIRLRPLSRVEAIGSEDPVQAAPPRDATRFVSATDPAACAVAERVLRLLSDRGVPNYYGPQRFGVRGDGWRVGRALARGDWSDAAALIAGRPLHPDDAAVDRGAGIHPDTGDILRARSLFDAGAYDAAAAAWPRGFGQCARLAAAMERTGGDARRSLRVVGKSMLRLYASAYQAWLFNRVLAARMPDIDRVLAGDLAWKHDTEGLFAVADPAREQARVAAFEISATGPLVGRRMREPEGEAGALERRTLAAAGLSPEELESSALRPLTGRRRPLRFRLDGIGVERGSDGSGPFLELRFTLPPGCYATVVLRELGRGAIVTRSVGQGVDGD